MIFKTETAVKRDAENFVLRYLDKRDGMYGQWGGSRVVRMFTVPKGVACGVQVAYALITNLLLTAEIYTMIATPFSAVMVAAFVHLWKTNEDFRNKVRVI